jgi:NTE family protein
VHDIMTIDPGLIDICMDYGWMRAADVVGVPEADNKRAAAMCLSDEINRKRKNIWTEEMRAHASRVRVGQLVGVDDPDAVVEARRLKRELLPLVRAREQMGAEFPPHFRNWWNTWERHTFQPNCPTPWDRFITQRFPPLAPDQPPQY